MSVVRFVVVANFAPFLLLVPAVWRWMISGQRPAPPG